MHPEIIRLYEYDMQNGTEYMDTPYIHSNMMSYRLEKLKELLTFDEEDPDGRLFILLSILLLKFRADKIT